MLDNGIDKLMLLFHVCLCYTKYIIKGRPVSNNISTLSLLSKHIIICHHDYTIQLIYKLIFNHIYIYLNIKLLISCYLELSKCYFFVILV